MKTVIIIGSSRQAGHTRMMCDELLKHLSADIIDLNDHSFSFYDYNHANKDDDFIPLIEKLISYDNWIFATPVYWYAMSAIMKTFFDRISDILRIRKELGRALKGKSMALLYCSSHPDDNYDFFEIPFKLSADYLEMKYLSSVHTWADDLTIHPDIKLKLEQFATAMK